MYRRPVGARRAPFSAGVRLHSVWRGRRDRRERGWRLPVLRRPSYKACAPPHRVLVSVDRASCDQSLVVVKPVAHLPLAPPPCTVHLYHVPLPHPYPRYQLRDCLLLFPSPRFFSSPLVSRRVPPNMGRVKRTPQQLANGPREAAGRFVRTAAADEASVRVADASGVFARGAPLAGTVGHETAREAGTRGAAVMPPLMRQYLPGTEALRELQRYPRTSNLLIGKLPFQRLAREVVSELKTELRLEPCAVSALQHAVEDYIVEVFEDCVLCATHAKRVTVTLKDLRLVMRMRGDRFRF